MVVATFIMYTFELKHYTGVCNLVMFCMIDRVLAVSHSKLEEMVSELSTILSSVKHEQQYMIVRERIHRASKCLLLRHAQ